MNDRDTCVCVFECVLCMCVLECVVYVVMNVWCLCERICAWYEHVCTYACVRARVCLSVYVCM